jgi:integrase
LRRGELRALRWTDINKAVTKIHVQRGWDDKAGPIDPKSKKGTRHVPIPNVLRLLLLEHKARTGRRGDDLVFGSTPTTPFTSSNVTKQACRAWAAAAVGVFLRGEQPAIPVEPIGLHECRHTYVSIMHAAGRSLEEIGDYVGHTSAYMTDRYRHLLEGQSDEAAAAFDAFISRSTGAPTAAQLRENR